MSSEEGLEPEQQRKLFLGGLNYNTTEEGLKAYFSSYGRLVDCVVMRFPDSKRSRGFGFVTYATVNEAEDCYDGRPHTVDGTQIETKKATPKEEMEKEGKDGCETHRKLFIGGLDYDTTDESLRKYFEQFGEVLDCVVMKFRDSKRSRGFGFVTYATVEMVDAVQEKRPHTIDGSKVETKRATPREECGRSDAGQTVQKIFVGGLKDEMDDADLEDYFSQFGSVVHVEQMVDRANGKKRGFGFIEFDDYDAVDKVMLQPRHQIKEWFIDVKKAISKSDMNHMRHSNVSRFGNDRRSGGGGGDGRRMDGGPAPWGDNSGAFGSSYGGGGGGFGNEGHYRGGGGGGGNMHGGYNGGYDSMDRGGGGGYGGYRGGSWGGQGGGSGGGQPSPWQGGGGSGPLNSNWEQPGSTNWPSANPMSDGGWSSGGGGGGYGGGSAGMAGYGGGMGGPMRNSGMAASNRSAPYSMATRPGPTSGGANGVYGMGGGGGVGAGGGVGGGSGGSFGRGPMASGGVGRW